MYIVHYLGQTKQPLYSGSKLAKNTCKVKNLHLALLDLTFHTHSNKKLKLPL